MNTSQLNQAVLTYNERENVQFVNGRKITEIENLSRIALEQHDIYYQLTA